MIARLLLQNLIWIAAMGALLLVPAGTLHWPAAWLFLATMLGLGLGSGLYLAKVDPGLLEERMRSPVQPDQPRADKIFLGVLAAAACGWFVAHGLDHRLHGGEMGWPLQALGWLLLLASTGFILWVMRSNSFAAPVVRVQAERGHRVIDTGPYALVRHPMYSGAALFFAGMPLLLGSWWGLLLAPLLVGLFAIRAVIEEDALRDGLPGYADYTARVRYRLIPGVW
jgi:protein-S-isoprenylcysteine O-methyltransferase Ste14